MDQNRLGDASYAEWKKTHLNFGNEREYGKWNIRDNDRNAKKVK